MASTGPNEMLHRIAAHRRSHPDASAADAPAVRLVDLEKFTDALSHAVAEAMDRTCSDKAIAAKVVKAVRCPQFRRALSDELDNSATAVVADPRSPSPYAGLRDGGNPITFFFMHFRLPVEAGGYYQSDLQRDNPRLFHALRNALRGQNAQKLVAQADHEIVASGFSPYILGNRISDIADLGGLLPARRGIEPRRPAPKLNRPAAAVAAE